MSCGGNFFLCDQNYITDGAVLALCLACLGAGRGNCRVDDLSMSRGGNFFLRDQDCITDGAVLALCLTCLGAGRRDCRVDDLGMSRGRDCFTALQQLSADAAIGVAAVAIFRTGRGAHVPQLLGVSILTENGHPNENGIAVNRGGILPNCFLVARI